MQVLDESVGIERRVITTVHHALLSGALYPWGGLGAALWDSAGFPFVTWPLTTRRPALPERETTRPTGRVALSS